MPASLPACITTKVHGSRAWVEGEKKQVVYLILVQLRVSIRSATGQLIPSVMPAAHDVSWSGVHMRPFGSDKALSLAHMFDSDRHKLTYRVALLTSALQDSLPAAFAIQYMYMVSQTFYQPRSSRLSAHQFREDND